MNIKEAASHIKNTMLAYCEKDENGEYVIPLEKQRPIFLLGAPGIGKTAIMAQIADELGVGLVSYSMTHHTRQSAIGLPYIAKRSFDGVEYDVSEYTMSEILASVYDYIKKTGKRRGILFLDEINCVSETLAPSMLRFLQYKTFGSHTVPKDWMVVTAGNPPEYNKSVREYDIATLDRIKKITIEPCYSVWREYAVNEGVHPAVLSYLDVKESDFYRIENTASGKAFVTARGWEDLSRIIALFEKKDIAAELSLITQYLQQDSVASDFFDFYVAFRALKSRYEPSLIAEGAYGDDAASRLSESGFSEKIGLVHILADFAVNELAAVTERKKALFEAGRFLKELNITSLTPEKAPEVLKESLKDRAEDKQLTSYLQSESAESSRSLSRLRRELMPLCAAIEKSNSTASAVKAYSDSAIDTLKLRVKNADTHLTNILTFAEKGFDGGAELQILLTDIITDKSAAAYLRDFGCDKYFLLSEYDAAQKNSIDNELKELF